MLKLFECTLSVAFPLSFLMVDSPLEIGSAASGQISAKAFEKHIEVGGGRVAAASGQKRKATLLSQCSTASGETRGDVEDSVSEAESEKGSKARFSETSAGADVPVILRPGTKVPNCFLCDTSADAVSPLCATEAMDGHGGLIPWPSYRKIWEEDEDGNKCVVGKSPKGCICLICRNCFKTIGYTAKYKTTRLYKKEMRKKEGIEIHKNFLLSRKIWIDTHNKNPNATKIKSKGDLLLVHKKLVVEQSRSSGFLAPQQNFVCEDAWDPKLDGIWDPTKVCEKEIFGKKLKGIFVNVGRAGVFTTENFDGTTHKKVTEEEAGEGPLVDQGIAAKSEVILASFDAESAQRSAKAVDAPPPMDMRALLKLMEENGAVSDQKDAVSDQKGAVSDQKSGDSESGSEDSVEDDRLVGYLGGADSASPAMPKKSPMPKTAAQAANAKDRQCQGSTTKTGGNAPKQPSKQSKMTGGLAPMKLTFTASTKPFQTLAAASSNVPVVNLGDTPKGDSQNSSPAAQTTAASGQTITASGQTTAAPASGPADTAAAVTATLTHTLRLDGRGVRLADSVTAYLQTSAEELEAITFQFDHKYAALAGESLAVFQNKQTNLLKMLAANKIKAKSLEKRISESPSRASLASECDALQVTITNISNLMLFAEFMKKPTSDLEAGLAACEATIGLGYKLSKHYHLKILDGKLQQRMIFGDHASVCKLMCWSSPDVQVLLTCCDKHEIQQALQVKCGAFVIDILGTLKKKTASGQKLVCETASGQEVADTLRVYCSQLIGDFVPPSSFGRSLEIAYYLLACKQVGVACLLGAVNDMNEYSNNADRNVCAIKEFFLGLGSLGDLIFTQASATLEVRRGELKNEETLADMRHCADKICEGAAAFGEDSLEEDGQILSQIDDTFPDMESTQPQASFWAFLDAAHEWLKEFGKLTTRKKKDNPLTVAKIQDMLKFRKEVVRVLELELQDKTGDIIYNNLNIACQALKEDGYLVKHGLKGAMSLSAMFEHLEMRDVMNHKIWKVSPSKHIEEHNVNCKILVNVISHILGATKAQKALGFVPADSPGQVENLDAIEIWLSGFRDVSFRCHEDKDCIDTFRKMFVQPFLALAAGQYVEASTMFRELCAECRAQKFGGIGPDTVKKLLCLVPDKHPARQLVAQFFDVLLDYKELVFAGPGKTPKQNGVDTLKKDVDDLWRKLSSSQIAAFGQTTAASGQNEMVTIVDTGLTETVAETSPALDTVDTEAMGSGSDFPATQMCDDMPETLEMDTGLRPEGKLDVRPSKKAKLTASQKISESLAAFGLHDKQFLSFVEEMSKKVGDIVGDTLEKNSLRMVVAVEECDKTFEYISISNEKTFRVQMKKYGSALAAHQEAIDLILKELSGPIPRDQTVEAPVEAGNNARNKVDAYISTHVAMMLFENSKVRAGDKAQMDILKGVLGTLTQATDCLLATDGLGAPIFRNEMAPIYELIEGVQPPAARPASAPSAVSSDPPHVAGPPSATSATSKGAGKAGKAGQKKKKNRKQKRKRKSSGALEEEEEEQSLQGGA